MPKDEVALDAAQHIDVIRQWIHSGGAAHARRAGSPAAVGGAARAQTSGDTPGAVWPMWARRRSTASPLPIWRRRKSAMPVPSSATRSSRDARISMPGDCCHRPRRSRRSSLDRSPRESGLRLVWTLLADSTRYADHWITFWNDLLRNEDGVSYFSEYRRAQEHHALAATPHSSRTCPTTSSSRGCSSRPGRPIPRGSWSASTGAARPVPR